MENAAKFEKKLRRILNAVELKESDQIPFNPEISLFPYLQAGYTMAEILYDEDLSKTRESIFKYLNDYDPDTLFGFNSQHEGMGKILEIAGPKNIRWAGMPGNVIPENSIHQYVEYPILEEDDFPQFFSDRSGWELQKGLPRSSKLAEPLAFVNPRDYGTFLGTTPLAAEISTPECKAMIQKLWQLADMEAARDAKVAQITADVEAAGYPAPFQGFASVPYDDYSDFLRGTLETMTDLYARPEDIGRYCDEQLEGTLALIRAQGEYLGGQNRMVGLTLHKGMDTFMSPEQYERFYWKHLQTIIETIIDADMIPYIYTEGKYDSRLEFLKEVPKGKVIYHFEQVDMARAKQVLGDTACIAGGFPVQLLNNGTPERVADEAKRLIDICAPGGGFIFETSCANDYAPRENMEILFDTIRTYGKK